MSALQTPNELKRVPEEYYTLYHLNPSIRDIFVEGPCDKALIDDVFFRSDGGKNVVCKTADLIEVSGEELTKVGLQSPSHRSKVIYLADFLDKKGISAKRVLCVVDTDYEHHIPCRKSLNLLAFTDFGGMEIYYFDQSFIQRFINLSLRLKAIDAKVLLDDFARILVFLYFARLIASLRGWGLLDAGFSKHLTFKDSNVSINTKTYSLHALTLLHQAASLSVFVAAVENAIAEWKDDPRKVMRGHDFSQLLYEFCCKKKSRNNPVTSYEGLEACLALAYPHDALRAHPLFKRIEIFISDAA